MNKKKIIFITSITILTLIGLFLCVYYYFISKNNSSYEKSVNTYITKINTLNNNINSYSSNNALDLKGINSSLSKNYIEALIQYKNNITKLNPPKKYKNKQKYLEEGLENNIMIYKQTISIVNNLNNMNLDKSIENLKKYRDNTESNYELFNDNSFKIEFPNALNSFIDMLINLGNESIQKQKEESIKESQIIQLKNYLEVNKQKLGYLLDKNNYNENIKRIREGNRVFEPVLNSINKDIETLSNIKISLADIPLPEKGRPLFNSFQSLLKDYEMYLKNLHVIVTEENKDPDKYMEDQNMQNDYKNLTDTIKIILDKYKNFIIDV